MVGVRTSGVSPLKLEVTSLQVSRDSGRFGVFLFVTFVLDF